MERQIKLREYFSGGKKQGHNDDSVYATGENFVAVVDGVSHKSSVSVNGKEIKIADIIIEAIQKIDRPDAPLYAKELTFEEMIAWINIYIKKYLERNGIPIEDGQMEATAAIYSRYHNQIWIVGDCRAIYDGNVVLNPLLVDELYSDLRRELIRTLIQNGYTEQQLLEHDISREIIANPDLLAEYIADENQRERLEKYIREGIKAALQKCGFSEEEIQSKGLLQKYCNPRNLQKEAKNNTDMGPYGYSVLNGKYTEPKNCKVVTLPDNVRRITLSTDGFQSEPLNKGGIPKAIRKRRSSGEKDRLGIQRPGSTHISTIYSEGRTIIEYATDDASAVTIEIDLVPEKEENKILEHGVR